jgi:phosphatidylglycerol---prolipoprotein diacylglyceryl transferase
MITLFRSLFAPPRHLILLVAALWLGMTLAEKRAERHGISKEALNSIIFYGILGYMIGGRLLFGLANLSAFLQSPLSIFSVNVDLFDPVGAFVSAVLVGLVYGWQRKLPLWSTLDALTPFLGILALGVSLSHLAAGTAFGKPTEVPWGIELWNATRHPTQMYEFFATLLIFVFIWYRQTYSFPGSAFLGFTALMAGARLFLEAFRGDSPLIFGGFRVAQLVAWMILALVLFGSESIRKVEKAT